MKPITRMGVALALLLCLAFKSSGQTSWVKEYSANTNVLFGVAVAGNGEVVAGGAPPTFFTSPDGTHWTPLNAGIKATNAINTISFANTLFLAGLGSQIATSTSGASWHLENPGAEAYWQTIYANNIYVNAGQSGIILTSPDGTNWTARANIFANNAFSLYSVAYGNGVFVSVGDEGTVAASPDGTNWTTTANGLGAMDGDSLYSVAFGNGLFTAIGNDGTIVTSTDGTNWTEIDPSVANGNLLTWVAYGNGRFVVVGYNGMILISNDGSTWIQDNSGTTSDLFGATYSKSGQFIVVGGNPNNNNNGVILVSQLPNLVPVKNGSCLDFTLVGLSGATAVLQYSASLAPTNWIPLATNTIVSGTASFSDCSGVKPRYYRAVVR